MLNQITTAKLYFWQSYVCVYCAFLAKLRLCLYPCNGIFVETMTLSAVERQAKRKKMRDTGQYEECKKQCALQKTEQRRRSVSQLKINPDVKWEEKF